MLKLKFRFYKNKGAFSSEYECYKSVNQDH